MGQAVPYIIMAAATAAQVQNERSTLKRQDAQAATGIRNQAAKQREADARVDQQVQEISQSTAADERAEALGSYMDTLRRNRGTSEAGLDGAVGGDAFRADSAAAAQGVQQYGQQNAELMARIDAPGMQRRNEAFGYGRTATDLSLLGRESAGQAFIDELRLKAIRKNPWIDAAAGVAMGAAMGMDTGAGGGSKLTKGGGGNSATKGGMNRKGTGP